MAQHITHVGFQPVKVLAKAFAILETLQQSPRRAERLKTLADEVKMPKATVFRLLRTLEDLGYLEYDFETETYRLAERLRQLGEPGIGPMLVRLVRPAMMRLVAEFEQTVNMAAVDAGRLVYKDVQEGLRAVRMRPIPGVFLSWDKTALGKSILAFYPRDRAISLLRLNPAELEQRSRQPLWDELGRVRKTGFALDLEESEEGLCCVAAPILGQIGAPVASISVSGSSSVLTTRALPIIGARLMEECAAVSVALGYQGDRFPASVAVPNAAPRAQFFRPARRVV